MNSNLKLAVHTATVDTDEVRLDSYDGRDHVVAPVVAVKEGVLKGKLLPNEEIEAAAAAFAGVPLPVNHPVEGDAYVSANTPERLETQSVGRFFSPRPEANSLAGETWVDVEKSNRLAAEQGAEYGLPLAMLARYLDEDSRDAVEIDANVRETLASLDEATDGPGDLLEVSTAYYYQPDDESGSFDGNEYDAVQRNLRPDHLALLPLSVGECSAEDGCGAPRTPEGNEGADADTGDAAGADAHSGADGDDDSGTDAGTASTNAGTDSNGLPALATRAAVMATNTYHDARSGLLSALRGTPNMDIEKLSESTGVSVEALNAMCDDDLTAFVEAASLDDDGDGDGQTQNTAGNDGDAGDDTPDDAVAQALTALGDDVRDEFASMRSDLDDLREQVNAREADAKEQAIARLDANGVDLPDSLVESASADDLTALAEQTAGGAGVDRTGMVGMAGGSGGSDATTEQAAELVANLRGEGGDD